MESSAAAHIPIRYLWKISEERLKSFREKPLEGFFSDEKEVTEIAGLKFKLEIQFCDDGMAYILLIFIDVGEKKYSVNYYFNVKSANYNSLFDCEEISGDEEDILYVDICSVEDFFNPEKKFIVNGEFIIEMKGMLHSESIKELSGPANSLAQYLWERDDKDFTIAVGEENEPNTEIKVHKLVIAARSPVFDQMIQTNMKEKKEGKVDIIDFDAIVVLAAVEYCYDQHIDKFTDDIKTAANLFQFVDKYDMLDLKSMLERKFVQTISPQNICEITNAAILTSTTKLRDFCFQTMLTFSKLQISVENIEILDKDFAVEVLQKTFTFE